MKEATLVIDLVCGQIIDADAAEHHSDYDSERYFFCCELCQEAFDANPKLYIRAQDRGPFH